MSLLSQKQVLNIARDHRIGNPLKWKRVTQPFGVNFLNYYKQWGLNGHNGIDYRCFTGTNSLATFGGTIVYSGIDGNGGISVRNQSDEFVVDGEKYKLEEVHYHLSKTKAKVGEKVVESRIIGLTGNSGKYTTAEHLHYGLKVLFYRDNQWQKDYGNGFAGCIDPQLFFRDGREDVYPVDMKYNKKQNWILEFVYRFANTPIGTLITPFLRQVRKNAQWLHEYMYTIGRTPASLSEQEYNAIIYGSWDIQTVFDPAMYPIWGMLTKAEYKAGKKPYFNLTLNYVQS